MNTPQICGKTNYLSKRDARTAINAFMHRGRGRHGRPEKLSAYYCPPCHAWHLRKADRR